MYCNRETTRMIEREGLSATGVAGVVLTDYLRSRPFSAKVPDIHHNSKDAEGKRKYYSMRRKMMQR